MGSSFMFSVIFLVIYGVVISYVHEQLGSLGRLFYGGMRGRFVEGRRAAKTPANRSATCTVSLISCGADACLEVPIGCRSSLPGRLFLSDRFFTDNAAFFPSNIYILSLIHI